MSQGLDAYRAGAKRNWRGWQWNRIVERLAVPVEDAVALYLCGPEDLDREKALAKGFRNENLIAVDVSQENVQRVRDGGGLAVCHDLLDLVFAWPKTWPLHVVVADFCAGLERGTLGLIPALMFGGGTTARPNHWTVVAANFQRGRDAFSRERRAFHAAVADNVMAGHDPISAHIKRLGGGEPEWPDEMPKHRGMCFFTDCLAHGSLARLPEDEAEWTQREIRLSMASAPFMNPAANSYTSTGRTYFDSVVFRWPGVLASPGRPLHVVEDNLWWMDERHRRADGIAEAARKITACRAVRTMKMRRAS